MKDAEFEAAIWGYSWNQLFDDRESCEQGAVSLSRDGLLLDIPFGSLLNWGSNPFDVSRPRRMNADCLYGFSRKGEYLAFLRARLLHVSSTVPGGECQSVKGDYLIKGPNRFDPYARISRMCVKMTGLREWVRETPFQMVFSGNPRRFKGLEYDLENEASYNKVLFDGDDSSVGVYHTFTLSPLTVEGANVSHDCSLDIVLRSPCKLNEAIDVVLSLSRFLSFCLGFFAEVQEVSLMFDGSNEWMKLYSGFLRGIEPTERSIREIPVPMLSIADGVGEIIGNWLHAEGELDTACRMTTSLISGGWDMPIDLRFLAASQAFEALTRDGAEQNSLPDEEYRRYRQVILDSIADEEARTWINSRMPGNRKGLNRLIKETLDEYSELSDWLFPDRNRFIEAHVAARHAYTHRSDESAGSSGRLVGGELMLHTEALIVLCSGIIWDKLGLGWKQFVEMIQRSGFKGDEIEQARKLYSAKR